MDRQGGGTGEILLRLLCEEARKCKDMDIKVILHGCHGKFMPFMAAEKLVDKITRLWL